MKRPLTLLLAASAVLSSSLDAACLPPETFRIDGRTCDTEGKTIDYATVLLIQQQDTTSVLGSVSDSTGSFTLRAPRGAYLLKTSFLGYEDLEIPLNLSADTVLAELRMRNSSVEIERVVVKADFVSREADRFVVHVAGSSAAIGRSAKEMLSLSPGVWIRDNGNISINGRSGTQIMIDDRLLTQSGEELTAYLNTIKAEDIQKIEVIPYAGADYDANMNGGIIKITLKRKRDNGLEGSVSVRYVSSVAKGSDTSTDTDIDLVPSFNLNFRRNKLSLFTTLGYSHYRWSADSRESNFFTNGNTIFSHNTIAEAQHNFSGRLGGVYEIDERQSVGAEINYYRQRNFQNTISDLDAEQNGAHTHIASFFRNRSPFARLSLSANYILKLDTLGSAFKILLDYNGRDQEQSSDFFSRYTGATVLDSTYRNSIDTYNKIYTATFHFDFALSPRTMLRSGAKYTRNDMDNDILYEYRQGENWHRIDRMSSLNRYSENIAALYVNFSTRFNNNIGLNFGLRGEYTYAVPSASNTLISDKQNYFGLFPNANISLPFNKANSNLLVIGYSRKISRPSFWQLNPYKEPMSEYSYTAGNPKLKPSYTNDYSLSWIFSNKYTLTAGVRAAKGAICQVGVTDPDDPEAIIYRQENLQDNTDWYLSLNLPLSPTKWWTLNANLTGQNTRARLEGVLRTRNTYSGNLSNTFTILKHYYFELGGWYSSGALSGNMRIAPWYSMYVSLKRSFAKNRFTVSISSNNLLVPATTVRTSDADFQRRVKIKQQWTDIGFSLRYNFKAGKEIKIRNIESGAAEEKSRL